MEYETNKYRLIQEALINDKQLQQLYAQKVEIYSMAVPTVVLKDGKAETVWIDETDHPLLPKINELIENRIQQITQSFSEDSHYSPLQEQRKEQ
jgi:hypothetical protein